nr:cytochrome c [uncultured Cohaesibacter sp.]
MNKTIVAAVLFSVGSSLCKVPIAMAHEGASGIVEQRMHSMKEIGKAIRMLKGNIKSEKDYDAVVVRKQARTIKLIAGKSMTDQFPTGSLQEPTHAKAEIWTNWERFSELANRLKMLARRLEVSADRGPIKMEQNHMGNMMEVR